MIHPGDFNGRELSAKDVETRDRAIGLRAPLAIHELALRVAMRLDDLFAARTQAFPVRHSVLEYIDR